VKRLTELSPVTGFEYHGTQKSRDRLAEQEFCRKVEEGEDGALWVEDKSGTRYYVYPHDWIIVKERCIVDVLDDAMLIARFSVDGDA
jgi:hypothetical protein